MEALAIEAEGILSGKNQEIQDYKDAIEEAEQLLAKLKAELESKATLLSAEVNEGESDPSGDDEELDLGVMKSGLDAELKRVTALYEEELASLRSQYTASLRDAEEWAEQHAENAYLEKVAELEHLKKELKAFRDQAEETTFAQRESRTRALTQSRNIAIENRRRIHELEDELAELGCTAREELREVRLKVGEASPPSNCAIVSTKARSRSTSARSPTAMSTTTTICTSWPSNSRARGSALSSTWPP
jgi:hypothetical protein